MHDTIVVSADQPTSEVHAPCRAQLEEIYRQLVQVHVGLASAALPTGAEADRQAAMRTFQAVDALLKYVDSALDPGTAPAQE